MTPNDSIQFSCNICGAPNRLERSAFGRETPSCSRCGSSVRARAILYMLSRELFGAALPLPLFPRIKAIRGIGLSDSCYDVRLAARLDYTNTYYHKEPRFDIVNPAPQHLGAYDFLISSEVFEHVAPPAAQAFQNACSVLKPAGILFLTVPYSLGEQTTEHFPQLHDYGLAQLPDRIVLVNRSASGQVQVFEDLCFHGGPGSTLETRVFTERDLRAIISGAGFLKLRIYSENYEPFGIVHHENWSLPMAAAKEPFALPVTAVGEFSEQWLERIARYHRLRKEFVSLKARFKEYQAWAESTVRQGERELEERTAWAEDLKRQFAERTEWARSLEQDIERHVSDFGHLRAEHEERTQWALNLRAEVEDLKARLEHLEAQRWLRLGRRLGTLK